MRILVMLLAAATVAAVLAAAAFERGDEVTEVSVTQRAGDTVGVRFETPQPVRSLDFHAIDNDYRARRWSLSDNNFQLRTEGGVDRYVRKDGGAFNALAFTVSADAVRIPKNYQPLAPYGDGGLLFYTGHFWPISSARQRRNAAFSVEPAPGAQVAAFGRHVSKLKDWKSPTAHPAFVYIGPLTPVDTEDVLAIVDPSAPAWIRREFETLTPAAFAKLAEVFDFHLEAKPNLFLAAPLGADEGRLSYAGDALPGQFQITLEGAAWAEPSDKGLMIFRRATIHEAVHLWQAAARPAAAEDSPWIHEGAADAIAAELMVSLGLWDGDEYLAHMNRTRAQCGAALRMGALAEAGERKDFRSLYDCGHVVAAAIAAAEGEPVGVFWREFVREARSIETGYTRDEFFALVEARTGDRAFTRKLRHFVRTPHARPDEAIDDLFDAARAPLAPAGAH